MRRLGALVLLLVALAACTPVPPAPVPTLGAGQLVLRVQELPGMLPPGAKFAMPQLSLYRTGHLVTADVSTALLPVPHVRTVRPAGLNGIISAAADAGLTSRFDYGTPQAADASVTVVTIGSGAQAYVSRIVGLQIEDAALDATQRAARERVRGFLAKFTDLDGWLGAENVTAAQPYAYTHLGVYALVQEGAVASRQWPLADLAGFGEPHDYGRCAVVTGADMTTVTAAASGAGRQELWGSGTAAYQLALRPLLFDETGCGSLQ